MTSKSVMKRLAVQKEAEKVDFNQYCDDLFRELFDMLIQHGMSSMKSSLRLHIGAVRRMEREGLFKEPKTEPIRQQEH